MVGSGRQTKRGPILKGDNRLDGTFSESFRTYHFCAVMIFQRAGKYLRGTCRPFVCQNNDLHPVKKWFFLGKEFHFFGRVSPFRVYDQISLIKK